MTFTRGAGPRKGLRELLKRDMNHPKMKSATGLLPVHYLYGPEQYLIDEEIRRLLGQVLSEREQGLNLHVFSAEDRSAQEIVAAAQTIPMFSKCRFISVTGADQLEEAGVKVLLAYILKPSPSTCLVLSGQTLGPWKAHKAEIENVGRVEEYPRLRGKGLVSWARKRMAEKGKAMTEEGAEHLVEMVGDRLHDLENALETVYLSAGAKRTIGLSEAESVNTGVKLGTVFDLMEAIGNQHLEKALGILRKALESKSISFRREEEGSKGGEVIPILLGMVAKQYRNLWKVKERGSSRPGEVKAGRPHEMSSWQVRRLTEQGGRFSEASLREGILKCHQADLLIKRGRGPKELVMEKLVIDLCRPKGPQRSPQR